MPLPPSSLFVFITTMVAGFESLPSFFKVAPGDPWYKGLLNGGLTVTMLVLTVIITVDAARKWVSILREKAIPDKQLIGTTV